MVSMSAPLALDSAAFGEAVGLRRGEGIVDSLAYIDTITPDEQRHAENLIKEEVILRLCSSCWPLEQCRLFTYSAPPRADQGDGKAASRVLEGAAKTPPGQV